MNAELSAKLGQLKKENNALRKKLEAMTENKKILEEMCIQQQSELNKRRSQIRRITDIAMEIKRDGQ